MSDDFADPFRNNDFTLFVDILLFDVGLVTKLDNSIGREAEHASLNAGIFDLTIA